MVVADASGVPYTDPDTEEVTYPYEGTWRFKYGGVWATDNRNGWNAEYQVNEEPLTAAQLAALNSNITDAKRQGYDAHVANGAIHVTASDKATWNGKASKPKTATVTLGTSWTASGDNWVQTVSISGVTASTKVDVQPDATAIAQMVSDSVTALYFANNNGTIQAVAVGGNPTASMSVQVTLTEVTA